MIAMWTGVSLVVSVVAPNRSAASLWYAALVAVSPHIATRATSMPWLSLGLTLVGVLAVGIGAGAAATISTLRAPLLPALRAE